jgi:hypothetical protein
MGCGVGAGGTVTGASSEGVVTGVDSVPSHGDDGVLPRPGDARGSVSPRVSSEGEVAGKDDPDDPVDAPEGRRGRPREEK